MIYLIIIFLEIFILLMLSKIIPSLLVSLFYFFTRSHRISIWLFSLIFLPGTLVHELAHLLTAGGLLVRVGNISLLPEIRETGVKLGHVEIEKTDPIRRALIGFAPVFAGLAVFTGSIFYATNNFFQNGIYPVWLIAILIYLSLVIGNTMFSSKKDLEGSLFIIVIFIAILSSLYLMGFHELFSWLAQGLIYNHPGFYQNLAYFLALPVLLDLLIWIFARILVRKLY